MHLCESNFSQSSMCVCVGGMKGVNVQVDVNENKSLPFSIQYVELFFFILFFIDNSLK